LLLAILLQEILLLRPPAIIGFIATAFFAFVLLPVGEALKLDLLMVIIPAVMSQCSFTDFFRLNEHWTLNNAVFDSSV